MKLKDECGIEYRVGLTGIEVKYPSGKIWITTDTKDNSWLPTDIVRALKLNFYMEIK